MSGRGKFETSRGMLKPALSPVVGSTDTIMIASVRLPGAEGR